MKRTLIIIPAYNVAMQLQTVLSQLKKYKTNCLVVNDGSTDNTSEIIAHEGFNRIDMPHNSGVSNAVLEGLKYALQNGYEYALLMDGDGQHNPADVDKFFEALKEHDFVLANRFYLPSLIPSCKIVANAFASAIYKATSNYFIPDVACGYKAFKISHELVNYLEASVGYSIVYRLVNYAVSNNISVSYVSTDAIYYHDNLLCTRSTELIALLESALELKNYSSTSGVTQEMLHTLLQSVILHQDFEINLCDIHFFAFYLNAYDSYIIQASLEEVYNYYNR